jgi:hypothetical protein
MHQPVSHRNPNRGNILAPSQPGRQQPRSHGVSGSGHSRDTRPFRSLSPYRTAITPQVPWHHSPPLRFLVALTASCGCRMQQIWVHHRMS